jgi:DNA-binding FadR family transcriptional regulator
MTFELRSIDRTKLYTSIVDQIVEGVRVGAFPPGSALPSERNLATRFGVSRNSVREAVRVLEHLGVLAVRPGKGTYVTEASLSRSAVLRAHAALEGENSPLDVMVARRALEPVCAEIAACERHARNLDELRHLVDEQAQLTARGEDPIEVDVGFHLAIGAATHNPVLVMVLNEVLQITRQRTWKYFKGRSRERLNAGERLLEEHRVILKAIEREDPAGAREGMRVHLSSVEAGLVREVDKTDAESD